MKPLPQAICLRPMSGEDIPALEALDQLCFHDPWPAGSFQSELNSTYSDCLLAEDLCATENAPRICAAAVVWLLGGDEAHLATLAVHPAWRGRGLGRRLLAQILLRAAEKGAVKSFLEVRAGNLEALHLYYGFGYQAVGLRPDYYLNPRDDALLLTLDPIQVEKLGNFLC